jgi:starvation-inducible DNA-binding protein
MAKTNGTKMAESKTEQELSEKQPGKGMLKVLRVLLADESVLYAKLRKYHWNVTGVNFYALHAAFEGQFRKIAAMSDEIAERIRQYGAIAPGTLEEFIRYTRLSEEPGVYTDGRTMVANLATDHETIIRFLGEDIEKIGAESGNVGVVDLLTNLMQRHQKMAWMLRMYLEG